MPIRSLYTVVTRIVSACRWARGGRAMSLALCPPCWPLALLLSLAVGLGVTSWLEPAAAAQTAAKIAASDSAAGAGFGYAVALSGETLLVGAYNADAGENQDQGAAYVYVRNGAAWALQQKLTAPDGGANDNFGWSVALNGNTAVIGAIGYDAGANSDQGAVYVFVRSGTTWTQQQKLTAGDGAAGAVFGWSVAVSGETLLAGALSNNGAQRNQGAAYAFTRSGTVWTQQQKLLAGDGAAGDAFGTAVALSGETALIGAVDKDSGAQSLQGAAYVFTRSGATWTQQQKLLASDGGPNDNFGQSVALSGETVLVGAAGKTLSAKPAHGSAYVFTRAGSVWSQQQSLTANDGAALDSFGAAVALQGEQAVIGAPGRGEAQGAAYVFTRSGTLWNAQQKLTASDGAAGDAFGNAVALGVGTAVLGAFGDDQAANTDQGSVYSFDLCPVISLSPATLNLTTVGLPVMQTLTASGGSGPYSFDLSSGALPDGLTLSGGGVLSGTPSHAGSFMFSVRVTDAGGCQGLQSYALTLTCGSITLTPASLPAGTVGAAYSQTALQASGGNAPHSFSVSAGALPSGLMLTTAGVLSGTPTQAGSFNLTVRATDVFGCTGMQSYTLVTTCPVMTLSPAALTAGTVGTAYSQVFSQTGGNTAVSFALQGTLPTGLSFNAGTATLSGTPTQAGSFPLTLQATDANGCQATQAYTLVTTCPALTVGPANVPAATVGTAYSQTFTASGGATPHMFNLSAGALPNGLTLAANGALSGTPVLAGTYNFTVRATDANGCAGTQAYTVSATCPVITLSPTTLPAATVGTAYSQQLSSSGGTAPHTFSLTAGALPNGVTLAANGTLSGTPVLAGTYNFTIRASDVNGCATTQAYTVAATCPTISLSPANLSAATVGTPYSQTLTASGGTAPYAFSVSVGALPNGLTLAANGTLGGTPVLAGSYEFTVRAVDANGCAGTQAYSVNATCPAITVSPATLPAGTVGTAYAQTFTQSGGNGAVSYSLQGTLPNGLTFNAETRTLAGTPTQAGSFPLTLKVTDVNGCVGMQSYTLVLTCPALTLTPAALPGGTVAAAYSQTLTASGGTAPYTFSLSVGTLPNGLTLAANGTLSGTPAQAGTFTFTAQAREANGCTGSQAYTLVLACPAITVNPASLPNAMLNLPFPATSFTASGGLGTHTFTISAGALPMGLALTNGVLSGTATQLGNFNFTITATDAAGCTGTRSYAFSVRRAAKADFDGDGKTDLSIWRGPTGQWQVIQSASSQTQIIAWGRSTSPFFDVAVPGDYDGDGKADQAIWRGADSIWYIRRSSDAQPILQLWGTSNAPYFDLPTPGDYDGDGKTDLAVFRPSTGTWYILRSSDGNYLAEAWGVSGDIPVPADYDGDGKTDLAVWRGETGEWFIKKSSGNFQVIPWGAGYAPYFDVPVPADYDGDGKADLAIWRGQDSIWYIRKSSDGQAILTLWGANYAPYFDIPAPGDYDGDGKADLAVWRPGSGTWFVQRSSNGSNLIQQQGQNGDTPVPAHGVR
jgi:hypothetical protein